jgi:DNA-binding MarR family transcriptional regulator
MSEKPDFSREESIGLIMRSLTREFNQVLERRLLMHNITIGMWHPLRVLWQEDGRLQNQIQKEVGIAQPTLVSTLDRMEKRGFIERRRSDEDRRQVRIYLTPEGKELKDELVHYAADVQALATRDVSEAELAILISVLGKMHDALVKEL